MCVGQEGERGEGERVRGVVCGLRAMIVIDIIVSSSWSGIADDCGGCTEMESGVRILWHVIEHDLHEGKW